MPSSPSPPVVLIVDDRADTLELYAIILAGAGFKCRTAADHTEARAYRLREPTAHHRSDRSAA